MTVIFRLLDYKGSTLGFTRIGERTMRRAQGRWSQMTYFDLNASHLYNPVGNATTWDGEMQFNYGQHYHVMAQPTWNFSLGGLLGAHFRRYVQHAQWQQPRTNAHGSRLVSFGSSDETIHLVEETLDMAHAMRHPTDGCFLHAQLWSVVLRDLQSGTYEW